MWQHHSRQQSRSNIFTKNSDFPFTSLTQTDTGPLQHPYPNQTIFPPNTLRERKTAMFKRHSRLACYGPKACGQKITPFSLHNSTIRCPMLHGIKLRCKTQDHPKICTLYVEVEPDLCFCILWGEQGVITGL